MTVGLESTIVELRTRQSGVRSGLTAREDLVLAVRHAAGDNVRVHLLIDLAERALRRREPAEVWSIAQYALDIEERKTQEWLALQAAHLRRAHPDVNTFPRPTWRAALALWAAMNAPSNRVAAKRHLRASDKELFASRGLHALFVSLRTDLMPPVGAAEERERTTEALLDAAECIQIGAKPGKLVPVERQAYWRIVLHDRWDEICIRHAGSPKVHDVITYLKNMGDQRIASSADGLSYLDDQGSMRSVDRKSVSNAMAVERKLRAGSSQLPTSPST